MQPAACSLAVECIHSIVEEPAPWWGASGECPASLRPRTRCEIATKEQWRCISQEGSVQLVCSCG